jgi:uncharacterized OsmC-like protein
MTTATSNVQSSDTATTINGIDTGLVRDAVQQITEDPAKGIMKWLIVSKWQGGTRSDHAANDLTIGGQKLDRLFNIQIDEPAELAGTDKFDNPQEYLLSALNACMMVGYVAYASLLGIRLTKLEIHTGGDIDLRGFFDIDSSVSNGYESLQQTVHIAGDATPEQFADLHRQVLRTSVNYFNITQAVPVNSQMVVE